MEGEAVLVFDFALSAQGRCWRTEAPIPANNPATLFTSRLASRLGFVSMFAGECPSELQVTGGACYIAAQVLQGELSC
jgi:hypothetical protein